MSIDRPVPLRCLAGLVALAVSSQSFAIDRRQHGQYASCREGDCDNGTGTIIRQERGKAYIGPWSNGRFVDATYQVQYGGVPVTYPMRMGADGFPREGTRPFSNGTAKHNTFTGTFGPPPETFVTEGNPLLTMFRKPDSVLKKGRYLDVENGYVFEGEFQYIPVVEKIKNTQFGEVTLARGVYVLLGSRIDEALDEVETGVFVSNDSVAPDASFYLTPASPSYLAKLQETLAAARAEVQAEKAASARASREAWGTFLGVLAGVAVVAIANRAASGSGSSSSMSALQSALNGQEDPSAIARRMQAPGAVPTRSPTATMSVAEYKRLREGGGVNDNPGGAAVASANPRPTAAEVPRPAGPPAAQGAPRIPAPGVSAQANPASRRTVGGTMYVSVYAVLVNNKSSKRDLIVEEAIAPVRWTYELANATDSDAAKVKAAPYPIPENLTQRVERDFRRHIEGEYQHCDSSEASKGAEGGCYGISTYFVHGNSEAEVREKLNRRIGSSTRKRVQGAGFAFPGSAAHVE